MSAQIVIRSRQRQAYLGERGEWCDRFGSARNFPSAAEAERFCHSEKLLDVEIIVFRPSRPAMRIPVGPAKLSRDGA